MDNLLNEIRKRFETYEVRVIGEKDYLDVFHLHQSQPEFHALSNSEDVTLEYCIHDITMCPQDISRDRKYYLGFYKDQQLEAVVDLLVDYPERHTMWIGLLMIDSKLKGRGLGTLIVKRLIIAFRHLSFNAIQLGVIQKNIPGLHFWKSLRFTDFRYTTIPDDQAKPIDLVVMRLQI